MKEPGVAPRRPTPVRTLLTILGVVLLAACGSDPGSVARDPSASDTADTAGNPIPTRSPQPSGPVSTSVLTTVIDAGRPVLCVGGVAESFPPQCSGPVLLDWDWAGARGMFEKANGVRWGDFAVTGSFDGESLRVTEAIPAALYDAPPLPEPTPGAAGAGLPEAELQRIQEDAYQQLPGAVSAGSTDGVVDIAVVYDDGSLQAWADREYGEGVVRIFSILADVGT